MRVLVEGYSRTGLPFGHNESLLLPAVDRVVGGAVSGFLTDRGAIVGGVEPLVNLSPYSDFAQGVSSGGLVYGVRSNGTPVAEDHWRAAVLAEPVEKYGGEVWSLAEVAQLAILRGNVLAPLPESIQPPEGAQLSNVVDISSRRDAIAVLRRDGTVSAWATGIRVQRQMISPPEELSGEIFVGLEVTRGALCFAHTADGELYSWGGDLPADVPTGKLPIANVVDVRSSGESEMLHGAIVLTSDGEVYRVDQNGVSGPFHADPADGILVEDRVAVWNYPEAISSGPAVQPSVLTAQDPRFLRLTWAEQQGAVRYNIYRGSHVSGRGAHLRQIVTGDDEFVDTLVVGGVRYYYWVQPVYADGPAARSEPSSGIAGAEDATANFAVWAEGIGDEEMRAPTVDPHNQGLSNALRFSLGLSASEATAQDFERLPTVGVFDREGEDVESIVFRFQRPEPLDESVILVIEKQFGLSGDWEPIASRTRSRNWSDSDIKEHIQDDGSIMVSVPLDGELERGMGAVFYRLKILFR